MPEKLSRSTRPTACVMAALIISVSTAVFAAPADEKAQIKRAMPQGYLPAAQLPDSLALLPPPPPTGSAALARDEEVSRAMARAPDSPRWRQAASDADLHLPVILSHFSCAAGFTADPKTTPMLERLFGKAVVDIGLSTYRAKNEYRRVRPFVVHGNASCTPGDEKMLSTDGSYPSGHSAIGWGWALILAEIVPEHADAILQRGRDFGQSRLVCNVHWASDVDAGRVIASATVARLHAAPAFEADLAAAKAEIARARPPAASVCTSEASALAD